MVRVGGAHLRVGEDPKGAPLSQVVEVQLRPGGDGQPSCLRQLRLCPPSLT